MPIAQLVGDARAKELADAAAAPIIAANVCPKSDAAKERERATFSSDELAAFLAGGADKLRRR